MDAASRSATEPTKALVPEIIDAGTGSLAEELARLRDEQGDPAELTDEEILELHEAADAELERAVRAVRSYALMAYQIGRALAGRKAKLKRGQYTPWVTKTLRFRDRTARRYRFIFEGLEALAARSGQHWPLTVLDLPVDKLESFLRKALKPGDSSKGGGSDSAASTEPDAGEDGDDHRDADTDEDADREDEDADADDEEDEAAGEPEAKAEAEDGDDEHDGDRSTSATETDEHEDADEGDAGDDDGDDEGGGDLLREFERVTGLLGSAFMGSYDLEALTPRDREAIEGARAGFVMNLKAMAGRLQVITTALRSRGGQPRSPDPEARPTP